jgi:hypothetical protein
MLKKNAVSFTNRRKLDSGFYSRLFLVKNASEGVRPVIDLSALNHGPEVSRSVPQLIRRQPALEDDTAEHIRLLLKKGQWAKSLDFEDA